MKLNKQMIDERDNKGTLVLFLEAFSLVFLCALCVGSLYAIAAFGG